MSACVFLFVYGVRGPPGLTSRARVLKELVMSLRHGLFTLLAALHLIWAACSALGRPWIPEDRQVLKLVRLYGAFSGVDNTFGFFAPDCGSQTRATFVLTDA